MTFESLTLFIEVHAAGSLAAAARRLRITPMAATRSLAALERELGVRLLHRTTRSMSLTQEGQAFLPHARALLEEQASALASVRPNRRGVSGLLRVTTSNAFGQKIVAPLIAQLMHANQELEVDLLLTDRVVDIVAEGLDLAIRVANLHDSSLVARKIADSPRRLVAAPAYIAEYGRPATTADLAGHHCITVSGQSHWSFVSPRGQSNVRVRGRFTSNSIEGVYAACRGGLGIANMSTWRLRDELSSGELVALDMEDAEPEPLTIAAVYPTRRMVPPKVRLLIDELIRHFGHENRGLSPQPAPVPDIPRK